MNFNKEFKERQDKIKGFKKDLKKLMVKYDIGKYDSDNYDGHEEFCGTDLYLTINGVVYWVEDLNELIDDCLK